jgi:hypothetical protein
MIDVKFFSSIGVPVYTMDEGDKEPKMINKSDMEAFEYYNEIDPNAIQDIVEEQEKLYHEVKIHIITALSHITDAIQELDQTDDYLSDVLDECYASLTTAKQKIGEMVAKEV